MVLRGGDRLAHRRCLRGITRHPHGIGAGGNRRALHPTGRGGAGALASGRRAGVPRPQLEALLESGGHPAGWNRSQEFLLADHALIVGVVKAGGGSTDGVAVLSGHRGRLGTVRAPRVAIAYRERQRTRTFVSPSQMTVRVRLGRGRADPIHRASANAAALRSGGHECAGGGAGAGEPHSAGPRRQVVRVRDAPALDDAYQSTPGSRTRDGALGEWAARPLRTTRIVAGWACG